jgi:hypothetical protein
VVVVCVEGDEDRGACAGTNFRPARASRQHGHVRAIPCSFHFRLHCIAPYCPFTSTMSAPAAACRIADIPVFPPFLNRRQHAADGAGSWETQSLGHVLLLQLYSRRAPPRNAYATNRVRCRAVTCYLAFSLLLIVLYILPTPLDQERRVVIVPSSLTSSTSVDRYVWLRRCVAYTLITKIITFNSYFDRTPLRTITGTICLVVVRSNLR